MFVHYSTDSFSLIKSQNDAAISTVFGHSGLNCHTAVLVGYNKLAGGPSQILTEILSVTKLGDAEFNRKSLPLGVGSALTTASGYYGELVANVDITPRWICQFVSRIIFCYILYELLAGVVTANYISQD